MSKSESGEGRFAALVEVCSENGGESCSISYGDLEAEAHDDSQSSLSPALDSKKKLDLNQILHRTSQFKGVTRHKWTGRYEAHLWDKACKEEGQSRKGKQVYLGGYDMEEKAARAYDLATLKYWGPSTNINFPLESYQKELEEMKNMSRQEYVAHLRRRSSGFSKGSSIYRGVTRHHQDGRWQARIGRLAGNKDLYLGTFRTQEEAAEAYDIAAIKLRGTNAVTNFVITRYDVEQIIASLRGNLANKRKQQQPEYDDGSIRQSPPTHNSNVETTHLASQSNQSEIRLEDGTLSVRSATRPETSVDFCDNR